jgi:phosphoribosylformimino-5-aminoimidazole carboxamide ribotide isomerase
MELIPAIDLRAGRVVRLEQGDFDRETVYDADPPGVAERLVASGATRLHVVDLDSARDGGEANHPVIASILRRVEGTPVQVGGGVRSTERVERLVDAGADRVVLGTVALENPEIMEEAATRFPDCVILGLDAREGRVAVRGWLESSSMTPQEVARRYEELPLAAILHTDIRRDGTFAGPNVESTVELARSTRHPVIASGGIGSVADLTALAKASVIAAAIVGRALYAGRIDLGEALRELARC